MASWRGHELPRGLKIEAAEAASKLISEYEAIDYDDSTEGAKLDNEELVIRLFSILCAAEPLLTEREA